MAINQLNKYVWLVETIHRARNRGGITLKEIQSRWLDSDLSEGTELSRRTFINNIHSIEELFEINIECGSGYRYNIEYGDCFDEGSTRSWMLNAFSLHAMVGNSRKLKERVLLEDMPSGRNFWKTSSRPCVTAIRFLSLSSRIGITSQRQKTFGKP